MIKEDLARNFALFPGGTITKFVFLVQSPGIQGVLTYRFGQWMDRRPKIARLFLKPVYAYLRHRVRVKWGMEIDPGAQIGKGFLIHHYGGIFIGGEVIAGENLSIGHNVTIGVAGKGARRGMPVIGKNVAVAAGATLHGKIKIGDNVKIGANAVVNKDVPDNALVQVPQMQVVTFPSFYGGKTPPPAEAADDET
jgi:serine O-acetyltransferase